MCFVMSALLHRRIYKPFGLLKDCLVIARHYASVRTFKTTPCRVSLCRPLSERVASRICCMSRRHLSDDAHSHNYRYETAADGRWSNRCSCCGLNSKGAQELAMFLTDELKLEKQSSWSQLPKLHGFQLISKSGPSVILARKYYDETVRIRFNVVDSLFEDVFAQFENMEGGQEDTDDDASPQLVCRPVFDVELDRGCDHLLVIHCVLSPPSDLPMSLDDTLQDTFYIDGVAMISKLNVQQRHRNNTYSVSKASISGRLRRHLLSMLARRGVGPTFARQLVELSTAYEHHCYVNFLEQLRDFMRSVPMVT